MEYNYEYFISPTHLQNYRQLFGNEATVKLRELGFRFIHVDDNGAIQALNENNQVINGYFVYERKTLVLE